MTISHSNRISQVVSVFHGRALPESQARLVGHAALIDAYDLNVPLPERLAHRMAGERQTAM
jgi:hypothetical protein